MWFAVSFFDLTDAAADGTVNLWRAQQADRKVWYGFKRQAGGVIGGLE